ncbi:MAG: hypothetical protein Q4E64_08510 [Phascolarctobacterium sp.]|uniref:hypothetical protein n=1 Tax=Phascolarctobacterium sp. TaxID=2049039 RepID=UPI0026DD62FB|nr:hypothetical protein [Phascolarctobacterium sp.]MDO4921847.1 hypothetical protein [Phascolarctobacterium sp.]
MADTSVSYKCLCCGAPLSFLPGADKVTCEYCGAELDIKVVEEIFAKKEAAAAQAQAAKERKWNTAAAGNEWEKEEAEMLRAFTCSSCGAEIVSDGNTMATECCYCGNPTMLPSRFHGMLKPDFIIPFKKTKEEAVAALKKFYEGKKLLPNAFTANNRVEAIQGMYVPFWLFDADIDAQCMYKASRSTAVTTDDEVITTTEYYNCQRDGAMKFERIPVDGSEKMDDAFMESIEPFDYREMAPFSTAYLTGYLADKYDVDAEAAVERADRRVNNSAKMCLANTVEGYDNIEPTDDCTIVKNDSAVHYAMAPVWILTTRYNNDPYTFMMNGQTGKVVGSLPVDYGKLRNYCIMVFVIAALLGLAIVYLAL